jgi:AcrR family transcriptional regulator
MKKKSSDAAGTATVTSAARQPQRNRGQKRFHRLLDATEQLLEQYRDTDISLAMIAQKADVPLPSVYHFFPNRNTIFIELARRFFDDMNEIELFDDSAVPDRWQEFFVTCHTAGRDFLNEHPAAQRLFIGAGVSIEVRMLDLSGTRAQAYRRAEQLRRLYDCRGIDDLEDKFAVAFALVDGIWAISYAKHGCIDDHYFGESCNAAISYLRCYLPENLARTIPH